jgi:hypothetical protein
MRRFVLLLSVLFSLAGYADDNVYRARYQEDERGNRVLLEITAVPAYQARLRRELEQVDYPRFIAEHTNLPRGRIVEITGISEARVRQVLRARGVREVSWPRNQGKDEVFTLLDNGAPKNRIDLVFMGDGYTEAEKEKFLTDIKRLVGEILGSDTFTSYLPLFNVHAVFRASKVSGIGKNDKPRDTAYKLYRLGDTLRAILPGDSAAARDSCSKAPGCDYPVIVANDVYYGGLGGEFAITTASKRSGAIVLRHELGHNFGQVGEEYDGQEATFFGANFSRSLNVGWSHWLSGPAKAEPVVAHYIDWPWHNLDRGPFSAKFSSPGNLANAGLVFSASGIERDDDLKVTIDGQSLPFRSPFHSDRSFYEMFWKQGFSSGAHELRFEQGTKDGNNVLSNLTLHEYGAGYHFDPHYVGAYPMFAKNGNAVGYRPTHNTCVMRNMTSRHFCPVCQENNWLKFFSRIRVIDDLKTMRSNGKLKVEVLTPPLGQLSRRVRGTGRLVVRWYRDGKEVPNLNDQFKWEANESDSRGTWHVIVAFQTEEVRRDPGALLQARWKFEL